MLRPFSRPALLAVAGGLTAVAGGAVWLAVLSGCLVGRPSMGEASPTPVFDPAEFFVGRSSGEGRLSIRTRGTDTVRVESVGTRQPDGAIRLVQTIRRGGGDPYQRTWTLRPVSATEWTGTLTEAEGPVRVTVDGNELRIRYRTGTFTTIDQRLLLQPGGRVALNRLTATVLGVTIARLSERIEKAK